MQNPLIENGDTLLHIACKSNDTVAAKDIISLASNYEILNAVNKEGMTAYHIAVINQNRDIIDNLDEAGAYPYIKNNKGFIPMQLWDLKAYYLLLLSASFNWGVAIRASTLYSDPLPVLIPMASFLIVKLLSTFDQHLLSKQIALASSLSFTIYSIVNNNDISIGLGAVCSFFIFLDYGWLAMAYKISTDIVESNSDTLKQQFYFKRHIIISLDQITYEAILELLNDERLKLEDWKDFKQRLFPKILYLAVSKNNLEIVKALLNYSHDKQLQKYLTRKDRSPLIKALNMFKSETNPEKSSNCKEIIDSLLNEEYFKNPEVISNIKKSNNSFQSIEQTALSLAKTLPDPEIYNKLLSYGGRENFYEGQKLLKGLFCKNLLNLIFYSHYEIPIPLIISASGCLTSFLFEKNEYNYTAKTCILLSCTLLTFYHAINYSYHNIGWSVLTTSMTIKDIYCQYQQDISVKALLNAK